MKTKKEIMDHIKEMDERDNKRDLHLNDVLRVVMLTPEGIHCMHESDARLDGKSGRRKHKGRCYSFKLLAVY